MTAQAGVRVLEADRGLAAAIPDAERAEARARLTVPAARLPVGSWDPESTPGHAGGAFGYLILDGLVLRDVELAGRSCVELLGPGDVLTRGAAPPAVPADVTWRIADPSRVAVLDDRVIAAMRRWPDLAVALFARAGEQLERLALQQAIGQLPRADLRLIATLWHLADRWGRVCPDGVELRLALTHDLLGRLVGARRPTVSLALTDLVERGVLARRDDRTWLLRDHEPAPRFGLRAEALGRDGAHVL